MIEVVSFISYQVSAHPTEWVLIGATLHLAHRTAQEKRAARQHMLNRLHLMRKVQPTQPKVADE